MDRSKRIAIVGGGPSGLAAAAYLDRAGFERVTVFEAAPTVGGKCYSLEVDGVIHELGAVLITQGYPDTLKWVKELDLKLIPSPEMWMIDPFTGARRPLPTLEVGDAPSEHGERGQRALLTWLAELRRNKRHVGKPGFHHIPPELAAPFSQWARAKDAELLKELFVVPLTCFGYGSLDDIPAAYVMKNMCRKSFLRQPGTDQDWFVLERGYQGLTTALAATLPDVRCGAPVRRVERGEDVVVHYERQGQPRSERFDALIVATPLDAEGGLAFLDLSAEERRLFSQVRYYDYATTAARAPGVEAGRCYSSILDADRVAEPREGAPCLFSRVHAASDVVVFYTFTSKGISEAQIEADIAAMMERIGGEVIEVIETRRWRYFPHVTSEAMAAGFFDDVRAMQGQQRTWYTGGQLDFDIVEGAVSHARALVEGHFI